MSNLALRTSALAIPSTQELEALGPADRWILEDRLDEAQGVLRDFNDAELRRWVEEEGKTQTEIARLVGRSQSRIGERCQRLGLISASNRGRPRRITGAGNSEPDLGEPEELDGEIVEEPYDPGPRVKCPTCGYMVKPTDIETWKE